MKRAAPVVHPSRRENVPLESNKRRKPNPHPKSGRAFKKAHTVNEVKSRIRSLRRLLDKNDNLPANVRVEKERALQSALHELEQTEAAKSRSEIIGRWHKVRFFDRQKATKRLKKAEKLLLQCEDEAERAGLQKAVEDAKVDVNYAIYYPLSVDYVSLFPSHQKKTDEDEENEDNQKEPSVVERQGDPVMWERVKQCMAEGTLDSLRYSKNEIPVKARTDSRHRDETNFTASRSKPTTQKESSKERNQGAHEDNDDDSDGGFFE